MNHKTVFRKEVEDDIVLAYRWYEEKSIGLGEEFLRMFYTSVAEIERNPLAWRKVYKDFRRCLLKRFPYAVYYTAAKKEILIYAVIHGARNTVFTENLLDNR
jgi:plasmid stabilization system protein ParE